ncbi:MAG: amidohydrolase [Clostridiales Family XIII bacterium]|jgi:predicted amidohydrolase YtcJ|nr:amidohydrolase [Clostridiales Family XIII bacterium]
MSLIKADFVIKNANIRTMDKKNPVASAIAVQGDTIIGVGKFEDFAPVIGPDTEILDLTGKTVLPGLNDNHSHPMICAAALTKVDLTGTRSIDEFFGRLRARAAETGEGEWVEGYGYDEGLFAEGREPSIEEMDAAIPNHPLLVSRACLHVALANSRAMAEGGYNPDTPDPEGGEIVRENGKLTGRLCERAFANLQDKMPALSAERLAKAMKRMSEIFNESGVTSTTEMGMLGEFSDEFIFWDKVLKNNYLSVRIAAYYLDHAYHRLTETGIPIPFGNDLLRFQGRKIILDGGGGSGTARMSEPNLHDGKYGILYYTQEALDEIVWEAHSKGLQIASHGIGDVAITMILDAYKKAQERMPRPDARHRLEHCSFCFPHLVDRVAAEGVLPLMHPGFLYYFGDTHIRNYGEERVSHEFPFRSLLDKGLVVANGSDSPVTIIDPRPILYASIARTSLNGTVCGKKERITAEEALYSYTAAGAYFTFDENRKGTLEAGKLADIIVTDIDPTAVDDEPEKLLEMKFERTILGGKTVFEA